MRRKALLSVIFFYVCQLVLVPVWGVKAYPLPIDVLQPDGTQLTILLHGDEFNHFQTTEDGYLLKRNTNGFLHYATVNAAGETVVSALVAHNKGKRNGTENNFLNSAPKADQLKLKQIIKTVPQKIVSSGATNAAAVKSNFPVVGTARSLVILVSFSNKSFTTPTPQTAFNNLLNQTDYSVNGGTGSAKDYFQACSYGKFSPQFDVVGPFTLPDTLGYYGGNDSIGNDLRAAYMVVAACSAANSTVDFSQYDTDNDGIIDNVFIYYAGYNEAEGGAANTIWPHRWAVYPKNLFQTNYNYSGTAASATFDGKRVLDYACTSELRGNSGSTMCGIGTFCHEFGHVLGLPDFYHTAATKTTLDYWSIMDYGAYSNQGRTPPTYSAYERFFLGYITPEQVSIGSNLTLLPLYQGKTQPANTNNQAYLLSATTHNLNGASPSPTEFFLVEYRKQTGWDTYLPAEGMCIWHIDYSQTAWDNNTVNNYSGTTQTSTDHMRVYLQPLSGSTTTPGTAFTTGSFTPTTWAGGDINRPITSINKTTDNITFKLMGGVPTISVGKIDDLLQFPATKINIATTKTINIKTTNIVSTLAVKLSGTDAAMFKVSVGSLLKTSVNSTGGSAITITYKPTSVGNHSAVLTISGGGLSPNKTVNLQGTGN